MKTFPWQRDECPAAQRGSAAESGIHASRARAAGIANPVAFAGALAAALALAASGCRAPTPGAPGPAGGLRVHTAPAPSDAERYCAWYGARRGDRLYFGEAPFWWAMREAGGEPAADLERAGPQRVGRFDLARERLLPPLDVGAANGGAGRSGVWDVFADAAGTLWFTTFFERAGAVELATGRVWPLDLGRALNELAPGPDGALLATRYGSGEEAAAGAEPASGDGEVIAIGPDGGVRARWSLPAPPGYRVAPKTPAWDAARGELWVTTDLLPDGSWPSGAGADAPIRHDAYRLAADGRLLERVAEPEIQFVAAAADGTLYAAEVSGRALALRVRPPPGAGGERVVALDAAFPVEVDFVQDLQIADDGRVALTRWSGVVHVLEPGGATHEVRLPRLDPDGLYYTAVLHGGRLCATHCADVSVVCVDAP